MPGFYRLVATVALITLLAGCAVPSRSPPTPSPPRISAGESTPLSIRRLPATATLQRNAVQLASLNEEAPNGAPARLTESRASSSVFAQPAPLPAEGPTKRRSTSKPPEVLPPTQPVLPRPGYELQETLPIDLPTVIRLVDANSPAIGFAQARARESLGRWRTSELQWLPNLGLGSIYNRFDGQTQNQRGEVFGVSRSNLFGGGNALLTVDLAQAIYAPLIARRTLSAEQLRANAAVLGSELEAVLAYLDLVFVHAQLEINADTLQKADLMLRAAINAQEAKLDRSPGDVNRARTEVLFRKQERFDLQGRSGAASARLGKLLLLNPNVRLVPIEPNIVPITLVDTSATLDDLVSIAIRNRPDLAANRELLAAAWEAVRKAQRGPLLPKILVQDQGGAFGGGINADVQNFSSRNVLNAQFFFELSNLGFGNQTQVFEKRAAVDQAQFQLVELQARLTAEVVEAAQTAATKYDSLALAEETVKEALELYRITKEGTFNVIDAKNLFDALRPLQSIQILNQARVGLVAAIIDFNRAQYRLYTALGRPSHAIDNDHGRPSAHEGD